MFGIKKTSKPTPENWYDNIDGFVDGHEIFSLIL